jgi:cell division septation protein DedD
MKDHDTSGAPTGDARPDDGDPKNCDTDVLFDGDGLYTSVQQAIEQDGILAGFAPGQLHDYGGQDGDSRNNHEAVGDMFDNDNRPSLGRASDWGTGAARARGSVPLWLLGAAGVSVVLLGMGGYGVMSQRAELQRQVETLQAAAAESIAPAEATRLRGSAAQLADENDELRSRLEEVEAERDALAESFATLEAELEARRSGLATSLAAAGTPAPARSEAPRPAAGPATGPASKSAVTAAVKSTAKPAVAAVDQSGWFVNFSSSSSLDRAEAWAAKLEPDAGTVTINPVDNGGRTLYRLRVVGLANRSEAASVARELERAHGLDSLWIGNQ